MIDIRCDNALHGRWDPVRRVLEIKCGKCSKKAGEAVFHYYPLTSLVLMPATIAQEPEPIFVRWRVLSSDAA